MKTENAKSSTIPLGLLFGLLSSQLGFVLSTPDNRVLAHGTIIESPDDKVQARIVLQGKEYKGSGTLLSPPRQPRQDMRPDRAIAEFLSTHHPRHGSLQLSAADGSKLSCELDVDRHDVGGYCSNSQQTLTVKPEAHR